MHVVRLRVAAENEEDVHEVLREREIDFVDTAVDDDVSIVEFPVPTDGLGDVLDATREAGLDDDYVVILNAMNATTPHIEELNERYRNDHDPLRLPELREKARDLSLDPLSYAVMVFLSAAIAAIGLLIDSPAIVVGAMVIAPLIGPVLTATVGAITGDRVMLTDSVRFQALGLAAAIVGAFAASLALRSVGLLPGSLAVSSIELIGVRMAPSPLSVLVGLGAGIAAAFGLTTKGVQSLVGVLIAAALVPAAAASGIAGAYGELRIAVGSAALLVGTIAAIDVAMYATLRVLYRAHDFDATLLSDRTPTRAAVVTVAVIVLGAAVAGYATYEQTAFQRTVAQEVEATLDEPPYVELGLVSIRYQYGGPLGPAGPTTVTVTVTRPPNTSYPALPERLAERIAAATDRDVVVRVQYQSSGQSTGRASSAAHVGAAGRSIDHFSRIVPPLSPSHSTR